MIYLSILLNSVLCLVNFVAFYELEKEKHSMRYITLVTAIVCGFYACYCMYLVKG